MTQGKLIEEELTGKIIGACLDVSTELGSGFLESVYQRAMEIALENRGVKAQSQMPMQVWFRQQVVGEFLADFLVEERVVLEIKAVKALLPDHEAQLINYLRASHSKVGLLINFGSPRLEWKRFVF